MTTLLLNLLLAIAWIALTGEFTPTNLIVGFMIGFMLLWAGRRAMGAPNYAERVVRTMLFALFFLRELLVANFRMAYVVLNPRLKIRPAVVAVPLDADSGLEITLLGNLITLTPGTLYLDCTSEVMYVHTIYVDDTDAFRRRIKEKYERPLMEILR